MPARTSGLVIDPYMSFRFVVVIEGIIEAGFSEVSGLQVNTQVEDFREGGVNNYVHKLPKETTFENLTLKKGLADYSQLWIWHKDVVNGKIKRKTIHIFMSDYNITGIPRYWSFKEAYPIKWTGPELKAEGSAVAFETIEFAHHGYV